MKALNGHNRPRPDPRGREAQRKGLLAKIHVAKKELGLQDYVYREILEIRYKKDSAGELRIPQLEDLVQYFKWIGWKPNARGQTTDNRRQRITKSQIETLREQIKEIALDLKNGEQRLRGLCLKICGVEDLAWCWEVAKLKGLLVALRKIRATQ